MSDEPDVSPPREELLRHILTEPTLEYCHKRYPGAIRLELVRRTRVVLRIRNRVAAYHLSEPEHGSSELTTEAAQTTLALKQSHPALWGLGLHIACEAMLALRNGHREYTKKRKTATKADVH